MLLLGIDCTDTGVLRIVYFAKQIAQIIRIVVPVLLIIMCLLDAVKNTSSAEGMDPKIMKKMVTRIIAAVCVFFVPAILNIVLSVIEEKPFQTSECWEMATSENLINDDDTVDDDGNVVDASQAFIDSLEKRKKLFKEEGKK